MSKQEYTKAFGADPTINVALAKRGDYDLDHMRQTLPGRLWAA